MSEMSDFDRTHVGEVMATGTWFTADLLRLIHRADTENLEQLRRAFPDEVAAWEAWMVDPAATMVAPTAVGGTDG